MKASRKLSWLMLFIMVVGMVLTACGGGEQPTNTPEAAAPEATQAPAPTKETVAEYECTDPFGCVTVAAGENLRIATALVISGPNESLGIDSQRGVEIAIDDRQEVLGFPIELVAEDGQCSAEGGQTAATKITSDETIVAVVGHNCSSSCTPAAPIYDQAGYTMISPSCTAPALTAPETHVASFLRTCHNDKVQGAAAAQFFYNELGIRKAATIHDGSPYAEQLQQVFADTFRSLGGEITAQEAVNVGDTDMRPLLTSIAVDEPELIYYPIFVAEGGFITVQAREIMGNDVILAGADGMISPDFVEAAGSAGEGMYITGPNLDFSDNPLGVQFEAEHLAKYGEPPISAFHAHAYDAANIVFDAVEAVGVLDADGNLHIPRQALREAVYATSNFSGVTGNLNCDANGDCADPSITVHQITNGEYVGIWNDQTGYVGEAGGGTAGQDLLDQVTAAGKLVVSTDPNYAPQSFLNDQGELDGFDVNVAQEVAKRLGVDIEFVTPNWDIITGGNWGGRWDVSIGSMTPTEPRSEVLWFTDPYYYTPAAFAVHQDNTTIMGVGDLEGKTIGLGTATTYEAYLDGALQIMGGTIMYDPPANVTVRPYDTDAEAIQDLALGDGVRLDAVMSAAPTIQEAIDSGVPLKFVGTPAFYEPLAFALDKGRGPSDQMLSKLNEVIAAMHDDGTLSELSMEWYGIDITQQLEPGETGAVPPAEVPGGTFVFGRGGDSVQLDPAIVTDGESFRVTGQCLEPLYQYEPGSTTPIPALATSCTANADSTEWTCELRQGVKFHDGTDFNADAVIFNFERWRFTDNPYHFESQVFEYYEYMWFGFDDASVITDIEKIDDYTIKFVLDAPLAPFLANLAMDMFAISSPAAIQQYGEDYGTPAAGCVGTGPFKFVEWVEGDHITVEANTDYWGGQPTIDQIVWRVIPDDAARFLALKSGDIDALEQATAEDVAAADADPDLYVLARPAVNTGYLAFNYRIEEFNDIRVREAVARAINKQGLVDAFYGPYGEVATTFLPPLIWGYNDSIQDWGYDPAQSQQLLADAGFPDGLSEVTISEDIVDAEGNVLYAAGDKIPLKLYYMPVTRFYYPSPKEIGEAMAADLARAGINVQLELAGDWATYLGLRREGQLVGLYQLGWGSDNGDPDNFLNYFFGGLSSVDEVKEPDAREGFYANQEVASMLYEAATNPNQAERQPIYEHVEELLHDDIARVWIVHNNTPLLFSNKISGYVPQPVGADYYEGVIIEQ